MNDGPTPDHYRQMAEGLLQAALSAPGPEKNDLIQHAQHAIACLKFARKQGSATSGRPHQDAESPQELTHHSALSGMIVDECDDLAALSETVGDERDDLAALTEAVGDECDDSATQKWNIEGEDHGGEELVVLPRAEYEALLERADHAAEDADDIAIYDARKAELAAGGVVLPPEVSAAILRGEGRLKAIRKWRDETQLHLEFRTGIGQGYLSDLENGRRTGTPETIAKLAQALNVPVEWLS